MWWWLSPLVVGVIRVPAEDRYQSDSMICVGTTSGHSRWEFANPKIQRRRVRKLEKPQLSVQSSLEVPARPPSLPPNCALSSQRIETIRRFCSFTYPIAFRSRRMGDIIDLVAEEPGSDLTRRAGNGQRFSSLRPSGGGKRLTFALPAGKASEFINSSYGRKGQTLFCRAERISKERKNGRSSFDYETGTENEADVGGGVLDDTSMWDSNAEGIRRGRFKKNSNINSDLPGRDRTQTQQDPEFDGDEARSTRSRPQKQQIWDSVDVEPRTREKFEKDEWDYDAEARTSRGETPRGESRRRWQSREDDEAESYEEPDEAATNFKDVFSWVNADVKDAFVLIRWGLPAAVLLVPWLMGNPMMLLIGLSFIPAANKFIGPIANQIFRTVMSGGSTPKPRRRRKPNTGSSSSSRRSQQQAQRPPAYNDREAPAASSSSGVDPGEADLFTSVSTTIFGDPNVDDVPRKATRLGRSNGTGGSTTRRLGGWEDLEDDRARARADRWPTKRRGSSSSSSSWSEKKIVKREERNIFVRLILALFPFLRDWGGLM
ncbi:hypothetical protein MPTK1_8g02980 [Marchantia polymorpha subsp. ruderalis]|uniref:Uncharacterized protein n=1 Tax=Marchantia polymorpha TaxID=3197 RepID=A0A2R6XJ87_MARPO|nr:hypothetical protein MARPO_0012s0091 [Marchantia polymorpha]BBN18497.1 hypothetical protein Mp_8g02980 [Marchantia polymorpha subsp. ruderalis]|eukprot:PTQ46141.1 hypothetical protein MARPO_0012s0091 [Marchantia polymorpha]